MPGTQLILTAIAVLMLAAAPAEAQRRDTWGRESWSGSAHSDGYRDGTRAGSEDARRGRGFEYQQHRDYREAGDRSRGRRDEYARDYRAGFVAGYRDAYYARGGRAGSRPGPIYGGRTPWRTPVADIAASNGFDEGYRKGLDDGRDRDRPDVWQHGRYRSADHGYRRDYGPKGLYQQAYRSGFERGYEQGYREGRGRRGGRW